MIYRMDPGSRLARGEYLYSGNGQHALVLQPDDGNLVLISQSRAIWGAGTPNTASYFEVKEDGNCVVMSNTGMCLWQSHTSGHSGSVLFLDDNCNLMLIAPGTKMIWAAGVMEYQEPGDQVESQPEEYCCSMQNRDGRGLTETLEAKSFADAMFKCNQLRKYNLYDSCSVSKGSCRK